MKIAVASGKGGTGKTTVSVNLALAAQEPIQLLDCDVEEPNAHIFLKGSEIQEKVVSILVPEIDKDKCDSCGLCSQFCAFNALLSCGDAPFFAPELCHGCGGCKRICPQKAIREVERRIGVVKTSTCGKISLVQGVLDIGVALAPPLIRAVQQEVNENGLAIFDAPPGTSCPVIATVRGADFVVLVTEPTPFGLNDLKLAVGMLREVKIPFGIVINRAEENDPLIVPYCAEEKLDVLAKIPDDRRIAEAYAKGTPAIDALPEYKKAFVSLLQKIREAA
ncbi:MAG: ATP-binding protein [Alphaproteobacteria bacterium]|nr:ATP-binding protein [Alphaproteobacteria bacterium]